MAVCVGCGREHTEFPVYDRAQNPVEGDGTYYAGAFACDECYVRAGMPVGPPWHVQFMVAQRLTGSVGYMPDDSIQRAVGPLPGRIR